MKSSYRVSTAHRFFINTVWIAAISLGLDFNIPSLVIAKCQQEQMNGSAEFKTKSEFNTATQQIPPELSRVRYPLAARTFPAAQNPSDPQTPSGLRETNQHFLADSSSQSQDQTNQPYRLTARFHLAEGTQQGYLILQVDLSPGAYIHSLTQGQEFNPSTVTASTSADYKTIGPFLADRKPTIIEKDPVFGQRLEKHLNSVQFFVPLELSAGVGAESVQPSLTFNGQVCTDEGVCIPLRKQIVSAQFGGYFHRSASQSRDSRK